ncbi:MAG: carbamoyltransferase HypF [Saprospiraceae bacterium]|nr:carbamoyltransferase HypF [Saprospiraceae bacterium]
MTWKISIKGQVQGVGFRPFVWRAAIDRNLKGRVANGLEGVVIRMNGTEQEALDFQQYILENAPVPARITAHSITPDEETFFDNFAIQDSLDAGLPLLHLTPDMALCDACRLETNDPSSRRYRYAFTTCTLCGPRYSILTGLPYDRPYTTMQMFPMCEDCRSEYEGPANRRYYAQTNSCPNCGIRLRFYNCKTGTAESVVEAHADNDQIIRQVVAAWQKGRIVAVKGIGGYLLTCDATNPEPVATLRARKHRPTKPFAVMYPDVATLQADAHVPDAALSLLKSPAAPIVLLDIRSSPLSGFHHPGIAPGLNKIGAMLPNAPLFEVLLRDFGKPVVATSGNISNAPLIYEDETAPAALAGIADDILSHNRRIAMPQDDSVVSLWKTSTQTPASVILRRARGLAPAFIQPSLQVPEATVLAVGADMKSTFTLAHLGNINISQYLGDLEDFEAQERFDLVLQHLLGLFRAQPATLIGDLHPGYFTTRLGKTLADQWQIPFLQVQHHEAHFAAVLAENDLFEADDEPVLGVVWDGTGFGRDGQIWGGEFLIYPAAAQSRPAEIFNRCAHFNYYPLLLGDKMPREPRISALSACRGLAAAAGHLRPKFSATEWDLYPKLTAQPGQMMTSSVGRMFDAVASLLGLADKVSYEGEAALLLEDMANTYCNRHGFSFMESYPLESALPGVPSVIQTENLFRHIIGDLDAGREKAYIAAKFHFSLVEVISRIAGRLKIKKIAFSGGVFQNALLLNMIQHLLNPAYQLYFHRQLSPNDENISFGQWAYCRNKPSKSFDYVSGNSR